MIQLTSPAWMSDASCRTDPTFTEQPVATQIPTCMTCPVRTECLSFGCTQITLEPSDTLTYGGHTGFQVVRESRRRGYNPTAEAEIDALLAAIA